jgi:hypothetical protein
MILFRCNPDHTKCDHKIHGITRKSVSWVEKVPGKRIKKVEQKVEDVPCPGGSSSCPDGNTCCQLSSGQWGW